MHCRIGICERIIMKNALSTGSQHAFESIGISCRICERRDCHQRSVPPLERKLSVDYDMRGILPYQIE